MKIRKNDQVLVISGKDKGRKGKIVKVLSKERKIIIEGMNIRKKHLKARKSGQKGQMIEIPAPVDISNVKLICPKCSKPARSGYKISNIKNEKRSYGESQTPLDSKHLTGQTATKIKKLKVRVCKKCAAEI